MVTITLHDKDALSLLQMVNDESDLLPEETKRIASELRCALLLCDCETSSNVGRADQDADEYPPQGVADHE